MKKTEEVKKYTFPYKIMGVIPMGWRDLGSVFGRTYINESNSNIYSIEEHKYCNAIVHIGLENNELFKFCPKCLVKTDNKKDKK